ncbi:hypothetical protein CVT25_015161 [Psilocybe cyanescens]|uniref:Uncharacterized protein n=1 Tax=Psilocybe cyanescens TaxID=93625 RepID=A0A409X207_PSICY|nr:hypothetical protein CVT25_015161 [Psilocybe cyanescens]
MIGRWSVFHVRAVAYCDGLGVDGKRILRPHPTPDPPALRPNRLLNRLLSRPFLLPALSLLSLLPLSAFS